MNGEIGRWSREKKREEEKQGRKWNSARCVVVGVGRVNDTTDDKTETFSDS